MGSKTTDTLKEIETLRARLDGTLGELEKRLPPAAAMAKRAAAIAAGGVGSSVILLVVRRLRKRGSKAEAESQKPISVTVKSGVSVPAALGVAAVWAGVRIYEARQRGREQEGAGSSARLRSIPA
jgi:hypothetical protein